VTKEDLARVANKYIDPDHLAIVIVGDRKQIEGPLKATGIAPVVLLDVNGDRVPVPCCGTRDAGRGTRDAGRGTRGAGRGTRGAGGMSSRGAKRKRSDRGICSSRALPLRPPNNHLCRESLGALTTLTGRRVP
jgi:hypothetical protein